MAPRKAGTVNLGGFSVAESSDDFGFDDFAASEKQAASRDRKGSTKSVHKKSSGSSIKSRGSVGASFKANKIHRKTIEEREALYETPFDSPGKLLERFTSVMHLGKVRSPPPLPSTYSGWSEKSMQMSSCAIMSVVCFQDASTHSLLASPTEDAGDESRLWPRRLTKCTRQACQKIVKIRPGNN